PGAALSVGGDEFAIGWGLAAVVEQIDLKGAACLPLAILVQANQTAGSIVRAKLTRAAMHTGRQPLRINSARTQILRSAASLANRSKLFDDFTDLCRRRSGNLNFRPPRHRGALRLAVIIHAGCNACLIHLWS